MRENFLMKKPLLLTLLCFLAVSCSSFTTKEDDARLKELENYEYVMRKDVTVEKRALTKNQIVRLLVIRGDDYIKAYAYPAAVDTLKAERLLLLYIFEDDFPNEKFDFDFVIQRLAELAVRK
jgi:type II secretion system-associated lipoprotein